MSMVHPEFLDQPKEELLERVWGRREDGDESLSGLLAASPEAEAGELVERLRSEGLLRVEDDTVRLTETGEETARVVIRRHRLAERLLSDIFEVESSQSEETACLMEHILNRTVTNAVCTFLGHPPTCPHGRPIPSGACCRNHEKKLGPVVVPLSDLKPGAAGRIRFLAPGFLKRMQRLQNYGVVPGTTVRLVQRHPTFVVEIEGTTLALDGDVAREIFVLREG